MKFAIIKSNIDTVEYLDLGNINIAIVAADLDGTSVDYATIEKGSLGIVTHEFGFFLPAKTQHYFGLRGQIYAGNAVIYQYAEGGDTIDLTTPINPTWFVDYLHVENAIRNGLVARPQLMVNNKVIWAWPESPPTGMGRGLRHWED